MREAPLEIRFGQLREVVVGQGARERHLLAELLGWADRLPNVRSHALVILCPGEARDLVEGQQPVIGKRLSKYLDLSMQHAQQQGDIPTTTLACALRDMTGPWRDPLLTAAEAGAEGVRYEGAWAVGAGGETTYLSGREVQLFRLLQGEKQALLVECGGRSFAVEGRGGVERAVVGDTLRVRLPVTLIYSLYEQAPPPETARVLEEELAALVHKLQQARCDGLGFGCDAVRQYARLGDWLASDWPGRYAQARVEVRVEARARQERNN